LGQRANCAKLPHMRRLLALFLLFTPAAFADHAAQLIAFTEGRYGEAVTLAEAEPSADNLAFAARSLLAEAMSAPDHIPPQALAEQAEAYARRAIAAEPGHVEGRLQLAIALSLRARPLSNREARRSGFGSEAKTLAEAVLKDDPANAYAHGFMAVWNIEVVRRGGSLGSAVMGASVRQGKRHYAHAIAADADDASTHWQYARALTALNAKKYRNDIDTALAAALAAHPGSALERTMQARALELRTALDTQSRKACERLAETML